MRSCVKLNRAMKLSLLALSHYVSDHDVTTRTLFSRDVKATSYRHSDVEVVLMIYVALVIFQPYRELTVIAVTLQSCKVERILLK